MQIDHTEGDVILVDDEYRLPIGRPWITLAIDVYSRVIMGYYLSFDAPSILSVAMCVTHAILPKEEWLRRHGIDAEWPVWGIPEGFHSDNAGEFRSESIADSCLKHGLNIEFRPMGRPEFGAHIERLIGNVAYQLKGIPGSTFSSVDERGETKPEESAASHPERVRGRGCSPGSARTTTSGYIPGSDPRPLRSPACGTGCWGTTGR